MTLPIPLPTPSLSKRKGDGEPVLTTKWTIINDHWVEAQFLLARGKSGLSDRPAEPQTRSVK